MSRVLAMQGQGKVKIYSPPINTLPRNSHFVMVEKRHHFIKSFQSSQLMKRCSCGLSKLQAVLPLSRQSSAVSPWPLRDTCRGPGAAEVFACTWPLSHRRGGLLQETRAPQELLIEARQRAPGHCTGTRHLYHCNMRHLCPLSLIHI